MKEPPKVITAQTGSNFRVGVNGTVVGIYIEFTRQLMSVSGALCRALNDENIATECFPLDTLPLEPKVPPALDNNIVHIFIGSKA
jgi:hypothetical protein